MEEERSRRVRMKVETAGRGERRRRKRRRLEVGGEEEVTRVPEDCGMEEGTLEPDAGLGYPGEMEERRRGGELGGPGLLPTLTEYETARKVEEAQRLSIQLLGDDFKHTEDVSKLTQHRIPASIDSDTSYRLLQARVGDMVEGGLPGRGPEVQWMDRWDGQGWTGPVGSVYFCLACQLAGGGGFWRA